MNEADKTFETNRGTYQKTFQKIKPHKKNISKLNKGR